MPLIPDGGLMLIEIKKRLELCFSGYVPVEPQPIDETLTTWEKLVIYMPVILITLPIITTILSAVGVLFWNNELIVLINFVNAVPGAIEAIAIHFAQTRRQIRARLTDQRKKEVAIRNVYIYLRSMEVQLETLLSYNLDAATDDLKTRIDETFDGIKTGWDEKKNEIDEICPIIG